MSRLTRMEMINEIQTPKAKVQGTYGRGRGYGLGAHLEISGDTLGILETEQSATLCDGVT